MNLLLFVTVMLMVLASMSYSELRIFTSQNLAQNAWVKFMKSKEGCVYNEAARKVYDDAPKSKKDSWEERESNGLQQDPKPDRTQSEGQSRINFRILIGKAKELEESGYQEFTEVLKNLITNLYADQPFFKKAQSERPHFLEDIFNKLREVKNDKIKKSADLATLDLGDAELQEVFYFFLNKISRDNSEGEEGKKKEGKKEKPCEEVSLLNYLSEGSKNKIRVYLASRDMLRAVFGNEEIVNDIIKQRLDIHRKIKDGTTEALAAATEEFRLAFIGQSPYREILDFTVTKTDPKSYE